MKIISLANVGNHLHFHIKLSQRQAYRPFIRAITAAIAMAVTKASRWQPLKKNETPPQKPSIPAPKRSEPEARRVMVEQPGRALVFDGKRTDALKNSSPIVYT